MPVTKAHFSPQQLAFQELFIGTLVYVMVLGFFNDYTSVVVAKSFSTIFYASLVLELLTYLAFKLKGVLIKWLRDRPGFGYRILLVISVWLVMFVSKFIFIWVLDLLFGNYININGFFGILLVVLCVSAIHRLAYVIFNKLGSTGV